MFFFSEVGFALIWWTGGNKVWLLYQSSAESCSQRVPIVPSQSPVLISQWNSRFFGGVFICIIHTEMNYWITWKYVYQIIKDGSGDLVSCDRLVSTVPLQTNSHFYVVITTVDSSPALKRVQMWIVSVSLIAACWGVHDRCEIVWFVLVGKKQKKVPRRRQMPLSLFCTAVHG